MSGLAPDHGMDDIALDTYDDSDEEYDDPFADNDDPFVIFEHSKWKRVVRFLFIGLVAVIVVVIGALLIWLASGGLSGEVYTDPRVRLPEYIRPSHYDLNLNVDMENLVFDGTVKIDVDVSELTDTIFIHAVDLRFGDITLSGGKDKESVTSAVYNNKTELWALRFHSLYESVNAGKHSFTLSIDFSGELIMGHMAGFYPSTYLNDDGSEGLMAVTDHEPIDARRSFPCFDEPNFKAMYNVHIRTASEWTALSNMPVDTIDESESEYLTYHFEETPPMSTYLVAFSVNKFSYIETFTENNDVRIRVYTPPDIVSQATYALEVAATVVDAYEQMFEIPFPLPKLDLLTCPDFASGAMENFGLITFRVTALLYDPRESSAANKQRVCAVVSHEIAHQWFGDIVTMEDFSDLWLNEGGASFFEYFGQIATEGDEWEMWSQFLIDDLFRAMHLDELPSSHPVAVPKITDFSLISQMFDAISYSKGSSMLRMLSSYLGDDVFMSGVSKYLKAHAFANAETRDLWSSMESVSDNKPIIEYMTSWTSQAHFPVITFTQAGNNEWIAHQSVYVVESEAGESVKVVEEESIEASTLTTEKERAHMARARSPPTPKQENTPPPSWWVPLSLVSSNGAETLVEMPPGTQSSMPFSMSGQYFVANVERSVYARIRYPPTVLTALVNALVDNVDVIGRSDRAGLIDDTFSFLFAKNVTFIEAFDVSLFLRHEHDYVVWKASLYWLERIGSLIAEEEFAIDYSRHMVSILSLAIEQVGFEPRLNDTHTDRLKRGMLLLTAASNGHTESIAVARELFQRAFFVPTNTASESESVDYDVPPDLRDFVYRIGVAHGGEAEWLAMRHRYLTSSVAAERTRCLYALASASDHALLARTLAMSIDPAQVKPQDTVSLIAQVAENVHGRQLVWAFFMENVEFFYESFGTSSFAIKSLITAATKYLSTPASLEMARDFFSEHLLQTASIAIESSIATLANNVRFVLENRTQIKLWLSAHTPHIPIATRGSPPAHPPPTPPAQGGVTYTPAPTDTQSVSDTASTPVTSRSSSSSSSSVAL